MTLKQETIELIEPKIRQVFNQEYSKLSMTLQEDIDKPTESVLKELSRQSMISALTDPAILASVKGDESVRVEDVINYIEKDAEILIPIDEFFKGDGSGITKKEYGIVLLRYLVFELKEKYLPIDSKKHNTQDKCEECGYVEQAEFRKCYNCNHPKQTNHE